MKIFDEYMPAYLRQLADKLNTIAPAVCGTDQGDVETLRALADKLEEPPAKKRFLRLSHEFDPPLHETDEQKAARLRRIAHRDLMLSMPVGKWTVDEAWEEIPDTNDKEMVIYIEEELDNQNTLTVCEMRGYNETLMRRYAKLIVAAGAADPMAIRQRNVKLVLDREHTINQQNRTWVSCPICGEDSMPKVLEKDADEPDQGYITCLNLCCGSNGGDNLSALPDAKTLDFFGLIGERSKADRELVDMLKELRDSLKLKLSHARNELMLLKEAWTDAQKVLGMEDVGLTPAGIRATAGDLRKDLDAGELAEQRILGLAKCMSLESTTVDEAIGKISEAVQQHAPWSGRGCPEKAP